MHSFWEAQMQDVFDLLETPLPSEDRITHTYHPALRATQASQIDAILVSEPLSHAILSARVMRYKDDFGNEKPLPRRYAEREQNPSDHLPTVVDIATAPFIRR